MDPALDGREPALSIPEIHNLDGGTEGCGNDRQMGGGAGSRTCPGRWDGARQRLNW